jgi:hypothetical protein
MRGREADLPAAFDYAPQTGESCFANFRWSIFSAPGTTLKQANSCFIDSG